jgi:hypothetical protein
MLITVGDYEFERVCELDVERGTDGEVIEFMPQDRYAKAATTPLNRYGSGPFVKFKIPRNLATSGVYVLTVNGIPKYIGEAADLSSRYNMGYGNISPKNCFKGGQETNCRLNNLIYREVSQGRGVALWFYKTASYKAVEAELRASQRPEWNRI